MTGLYILLFFTSLVLLIVGLINPAKVKIIFRKIPSRKIIALTFIGSALVFLMVIGFTAHNTNIQNGVHAPDIIVAETQIPVAPTSDAVIVSSTAPAVTPTLVANNSSVSSSSIDGSGALKEIASSNASNSDLVYYTVVSVVDGDTIKVNIDDTVTTLRLIGMDTPETVDPRKTVQCFGKEASEKAKELLTGKKVRLETDPTQGELDKYGRRLAYIYREDGIFYNKYMIEQGYAHEYTYNTPYIYQTEFKAAQKSAQDNLRGLWSPDTCNGDTTQSAESAASSSSNTSTTDATVSTPGVFYTSSYGTTKYYYPESCDGWKSLSTKYLKSFDSLEALLAAYPSRTLSPQCQ